jgi:hypothetical protein
VIYDLQSVQNQIQIIIQWKELGQNPKQETIPVVNQNKSRMKT